MMRWQAFLWLIFAALALPATARAANGNLAIVAVVGSDVISSYDVNSRVSLITTTTNLPNTPEALANLKPQVIRILIEEKLQLQEAAKNNIAISDQDVAKAIASIEKERGMSAGFIAQTMEKNRIPKETFFQQIRAQLAWYELVRRKIRPLVRISDEEVRQLPTTAGVTVKEMQIAVFTLPVDSPKRESEVARLSEKLVKDIRNGASFEEIARQFSARTGGVKSDTFWVRPEQLDPILAKSLAGITGSAVTGPVRISQGFAIVKIYDVRTNGNDAVPDTEISLKEILLKLKVSATKEDSVALLAAAENIAKHPGACENKKLADTHGLAESDIDISFRNELASNLPPAIRTIADGLKPGEISTPFASDQGIRLYMLCDRKETSAASAAHERVRNQLFQQKLELEAQKYLRNLKQATFVEIR